MLTVCSTNSNYQNHCQVYIPWIHTFLSETLMISEAVLSKKNKARQGVSMVRRVFSLWLPRGTGDSTGLKSSEPREGHQHGNDTLVITSFQPQRKQLHQLELSAPSPKLFSFSLTPSVIKENTNKNQFRLFVFFLKQKENQQNFKHLMVADENIKRTFPSRG